MKILVDVELLKKLKEEIEDLMQGCDDYHQGRTAQQMIADGNVSEEYLELCKLIEEHQ